MNKEFDELTRNDYANGEELTVTITLAEYRDLVADNQRLSITHLNALGKIAELEGRIRELTQGDAE